MVLRVVSSATSKVVEQVRYLEFLTPLESTYRNHTGYTSTNGDEYVNLTELATAMR